MNLDNINHISYAVSYRELISIWVDLYFRTEHIMIIHDPLNHIEYLRSLDVEMDDMNLYESKLLVVHMTNLDDAIDLCKYMCYKEGPYAEVWSLGNWITDNIDKQN